MRPVTIVMTADPDLPVPPRYYGGIERVIAILVAELAQRGHRITLLAHRDSSVPCDLEPYPNARGTGGPLLTVARHAETLRRLVARVRPDVVHSFGRVAYLLPILAARVPKIMSYQRPITARTIRVASWVSKSSMTWTACSRALTRPVAALAPWHVVPNPVDVLRFTAVTRVAEDAPLMFLGRIEPIKGTHIAIAVARAAGRRLVIAGNVPQTHEAQAYFAGRIAPHLGGPDVIYVGPVDDVDKARRLADAAALLMPVQWDEPFGIVMAEALACGTPVIGLNRGAVSEVVEDGVTGFVCADVSAMHSAVARLPQICRAECRRAAERLFSASVVADQYESVYGAAIVGEPVTAVDQPFEAR